jgi:hypothetical protein
VNFDQVKKKLDRYLAKTLRGNNCKDQASRSPYIILAGGGV